MPQLIRLYLPLLAASVLQQLYNIINSLVVTYYIGDNAFAALGVAESVMNLFIFVITTPPQSFKILNTINSMTLTFQEHPHYFFFPQTFPKEAGL